MEQVNLTLSFIIQLLALVAIPIVIAAAVQAFRVYSKDLRQQIGDERWEMIENAVTSGVTLAEQAGIVERLAGPEKKQMAIAFVEEKLRERGIQLDVEAIANLIEAEVKRQFENPTSPQELLADRQALIERVARSAVLAAEQSGAAGQIVNDGRVKKEYAIDFASNLLGQYGIDLDEEALSRMIEAALMQLIIEARGDAPETPTQ